MVQPVVAALRSLWKGVESQAGRGVAIVFMVTWFVLFRAGASETFDALCEKGTCIPWRGVAIREDVALSAPLGALGVARVGDRLHPPMGPH